MATAATLWRGRALGTRWSDATSMLSEDVGNSSQLLRFGALGPTNILVLSAKRGHPRQIWRFVL